MRLEAMKRQAGRPTKNNLVPVGQNYSREELAAQSGESQTQIQRYIRLTNLVPELLEFVDEGRIKMRPAVELSYLDEDCQRDVVDEKSRERKETERYSLMHRRSRRSNQPKKNLKKQNSYKMCSMNIILAIRCISVLLSTKSYLLMMRE